MKIQTKNTRVSAQISYLDLCNPCPTELLGADSTQVKKKPTAASVTI